VAKVLIKSSSKEASLTAGTWPYLSPEQFKGKQADKSGDIYAIGILFHELITGTLPFSASDFHILKDAVINETPEPLTELTRDQNQILLKNLAKKPANRYGSAKDFINALKENSAAVPKKKNYFLPIAGLIIIISAGIAYFILFKIDSPQQQLINSLFSKTKLEHPEIKDVGLVPGFSNCPEFVYEKYKTTLINTPGYQILERKELSNILNEQDIANLFATGINKEVLLGIKNTVHSQAVVAGRCIDNQLFLRLISTETGVNLGAADIKIKALSKTDGLEKKHMEKEQEQQKISSTEG
jgi:hypothetical protein